MKQIVIVDYGSQYTHLILARLREEGHEALVVSPDAPVHAFQNACGLILSGGPASVYEEGAPQLSNVLIRLIFEEKIPTLGICYGMQLIAQYAARNYYPAVKSKKAEGKEVGEYGKAILEISHNIGVLKGLGKQEVVWMSHGDSVVLLPPDFQRLTPFKDRNHPEDNPPIAIRGILRPIFCLQFHPEVSHTRSGRKILKNFLEICGAEKNWDAKLELERIRMNARIQIDDKHIFAFISGGNDSSVLARFLQEIVPEERLHFFYVRGLGPDEDLEKIKLISGNFHIVDARRRIYRSLKGIVDPEEKRQIIGRIFLRIFKEEAKKLAKAVGCDIEDLILAQGTIHPDVIESGPGGAAKIKSHHNTVLRELLEVGKIIEPFMDLFKPDVRRIGQMLGVDERLITQHPSPGPGYAVRFLCYDGGREPPLSIEFANSEPTDKKFIEAMSCEHELREICRKAGYSGWVLPLKSKGVQGDQNSYCYTAGIIGLVRRSLGEGGTYEREPLLELASEIPNRFKGKINRVIYLVAPHYATSLRLAGLKKGYFRAETRNIEARADKILVKNLRLANLYPLISQAFVVVSTLSFNKLGYSAIIRAVNTEDYMTAEPCWLPWLFLEKTANEMMRAIPEIRAVFYDLTTKPPGTIEWE